MLVGNKVDLYSTTKNTVQKAEAISLAKKYGMEYFETCSIGDSSITPIFDYLFTTITVSIPNPPTPQSLVGKGVLLGKKLINSPKYHLALCEIATLYEWLFGRLIKNDKILDIKKWAREGWIFNFGTFYRILWFHHISWFISLFFWVFKIKSWLILLTRRSEWVGIETSGQ